jgi:hypothetical protein
VCAFQVGFLYAIHQGAQAIWDFDDDNILKANKPINTMDAFGPACSVMLTSPSPSYNPYAEYKTSVKHPWPRGFPLLDIKKSHTTKVSVHKINMPVSKIGLVQR